MREALEIFLYRLRVLRASVVNLTSPPPEPRDGVGGEVNDRWSAAREVGDEAAGGGGLGQADVAMAEGVEHARVPSRRADYGEPIRRGRAVAHPFRAAGGLETGQVSLGQSHERLAAPVVGGCREAKIGRASCRERV